MRFYTLACAAILSFGMAAAAHAESAWMTDFEEAKALSAKTGKPILADFTGSDWCGWCIRLKKEVFKKESFSAYAKDNLILFMADYPRKKKQSEEIKKQNKKLAKTYSIRGYPTILLLSAEGEVIAKTGYRQGGPDKYVEHLKELLADTEASSAVDK